MSKCHLNARKGNLKEHICIVQRAVLGTQGWTRSALQSCTPAYSRASLWHQFLRDTAAPNQHTHMALLAGPDPSIQDDSIPFHVNSSVCCQQAWVITTLSTAWCVPHLLKAIYCSSRLQVLLKQMLLFPGWHTELASLPYQFPIWVLSSFLQFLFVLCQIKI